MAPDSRTYIRLHDGMPDHPKVDGLTDAAFRAYVTLLCHSRDGYATFEEIASLHPRARHQPYSNGLIDSNRALWGWHGLHRADCRASIPDAVRFAVYDRDGWSCLACGAPEPLSLDHIWPWSLGGTDDAVNLQTLCIPCNSRKGARVGDGQR